MQATTLLSTCRTLFKSAPCCGFIVAFALNVPNVGVLLLPVDVIPVDCVVFIFSAENNAKYYTYGTRQAYK